MKTLENRILAMTISGHALCHIFMLILAAVLIPITKEFNVTITQLTSIGTISYFLFGLGAFPSGLFAQRTNAKLTLKLFFLLSGIASLVLFFSPNLLSFGIGLALLGASGSLYHVSGLTLISQGIEQRGKAMGIHGVAGSFGIAITPLLASGIYTLWGWRYVYLTAAIISIFLFLFLMVDKIIPAAHVQIKQKKEAASQKSMMPVFILFLLTMAANGFLYRGFMTLIPTYVAEKVTIESLSQSFSGGLITTFILSIGMIGQYWGGHLSDKHKMSVLYLVTLMCSLPFLFSLSLLSQGFLVASAVFFTLFHFPQQPVENHLISHLMPSKWVSLGYGIKFTMTFGVGSFASGFVGYLTDQWHMGLVFQVLTGVGLLSVIMLLAVNYLLKKNHQLI